MIVNISPTPSNTASNTPTNTNSGTPCPATPTNTPSQTATPTLTPSPTFCYNPKAYLVLDAQSGSSALNTWMISQGSSFRGLWINSPSNTQAIFEAQMNAYISYTGFGATTFYIEDEPIVSTTSLFHLPEQSFSTNVWNTWFVPTCPFCEGGNWTTWNGATLNAAQYNKPFYYSGSAIPQGYYKWLTTYTNTNQRLNVEVEHTLSNLICPSTPTPTPTITRTQTSTPTITPTNTTTPSQTQTQTNTTTPSLTPTQTLTPTCGTYTTQYLQSEIQGNDNIKYTLFDNPDYTGNANAICDYLISGTYNITGGAINVPYSTIMVYNDHTHTYNTGEGNISGFTVSSVSAACPCVNVIFNQITPTPTPTITQTQTSTPSATIEATPTNTQTQTNTPTQTTTQTITPTNTATPTPSPVSECISYVVVNTQPSLDIPIYDVYVNGVQVVYSSGANWTITPANSPGTFTTSQTGATQTVLVYYGANIAGQRIEILDCNETTTCQNINPGGGIATFTDVAVGCGCYWSINGYDGTC